MEISAEQLESHLTGNAGTRSKTSRTVRIASGEKEGSDLSSDTMDGHLVTIKIESSTDPLQKVGSAVAKKHPVIGPETSDDLVEFAMMYLLDQPTDTLRFSTKYFKQKREATTQIILDIEEKLEISHKFLSKLLDRNYIMNYELFSDTDVSSPLPFHAKTKEQLERLTRDLAKTFITYNLTEEQRELLIRAVYKKEVKAGEVIVKQGDPADFFYIVSEGVFEAQRIERDQPILVHIYEHMGSFGQLSLMYDRRKHATVTALTDGSLWQLEGKTFKFLVRKTIYQHREKYERFIDCIPFLRSLPPYDKLDLCDALVPKYYRPDELVLKCGGVAKGLYFIDRGSVAVRIPTRSGKIIEANIMEDGGFFGELELIEHCPNVANVQAVTDLSVLFLNKFAFERLMEPCVELIQRRVDNYPRPGAGHYSRLHRLSQKSSASVMHPTYLSVYKL